MDIKITGAEEFGDLARRLKQVDDKLLRRELHSGINRAVKPLTQDVKSSPDEFMPSGYAAELSGTLKIKTSKRTGRDSGVRLRATASTSNGKPRQLSALNRGRLRHPLYGNRRHWFNQAVRPGFWDRPLEEGGPQVRREIIKVMHQIAAKIAR